MAPVKIAFLLYPNVTQLDLTAPAQLLAMAGIKVELVARTSDPVPTDSGFSISDNHSTQHQQLQSPDKYVCSFVKRAERLGKWHSHRSSCSR